MWASDLKIKVLWRASAAGDDLAVVERRLAQFNDRLYDCTDGQWRVGRFLIHDHRSELGAEDDGVGHIHRVDTHGPHGHASGRPNDPEHWHTNEAEGVDTYLMEFLHSWTGLKDEYEVSEDGPSTNCPATAALRDATNACAMDTSYGAPTELCRPDTHNPVTEQGNVHGMDCYTWLAHVMRQAGKEGFVVPDGHIPGPAIAPPLRFVYLTVLEVNQLDSPEGLGAGVADYYGRVSMDGLWFARTKHREDVSHVRPNWLFGLGLSGHTHRTVPIRVVLWDHDSTSADDLCDINPRPGKHRLDFVFNTGTGEVTGDVVGRRDSVISAGGSGDGNRAEIRFVVQSR